MTNLMQIPGNQPGFNWTDVLYTTLSSSPLSLTFLFDILGSEKIPSSPPSILHCHTFERFVGFILRSLFWLGWWNWRLKFPVYIHFKLILWYDDQNLISLNHQHFKNIAHIGSFKHFRIWRNLKNLKKRPSERWTKILDISKRYSVLLREDVLTSCSPSGAKLADWNQQGMSWQRFERYYWVGISSL